MLALNTLQVAVLFFVVSRVNNLHAKDILSQPTAKLMLYYQHIHADCLKSPCYSFTVKGKTMEWNMNGDVDRSLSNIKWITYINAGLNIDIDLDRSHLYYADRDRFDLQK